MKKSCLAFIAFLSVIQFSYAQWTTSGTDIYNSNPGSVGIGTNTPTAKLDISTTATQLMLHNGSSSAAFALNPSGTLHLSTTSNITISPAQILNLTSVNNTEFVMDAPSEAVSSFRIRSGTMGSVSDYTISSGTGSVNNIRFTDNRSAVTVMTLASNDCVGIGTVHPKNMLDVNGTIHSKQVNVDLIGWSDYVFDKDYHLPTLAEIETYINQNHHLAEIPSAAEIAKNGIDLGEMNKLLLKKVEELTLYLIEKDKEIKELKKQQSDTRLQQKQIDQLINQVAQLSKTKNQ